MLRHEKFSIQRQTAAAALLFLTITADSLISQPTAGRPIGTHQAVVVLPNIGTGSFRRVFLGAGSTVLALDAEKNSVVVFSENGVHQNDFGGNGSGRSQFTSPIGFGLRGDRIWVFDVIRQQVSYWTQAGVLSSVDSLPSFPWPLETFLSVKGVSPSGKFWLEESSGPNGITRMAQQGRIVGQASPDVQGFDTIARLRFDDAVFLLRLPDGGIILRPQPWAPIPFFAASANGEHAAIAEQWLSSDTISINYWSWPSQRWTRKAVRIASQPLLDADVERTIDRFATDDVLASFRDTTALRLAVREALFVPEKGPQFSRLIVGSDGTIWLLRSTEWEEAQHWLVLMPSGEEIGTVHLPSQIRLQDANVASGRAVGLRRTADGRTSISIMRFVPELGTTAVTARADSITIASVAKRALERFFPDALVRPSEGVLFILLDSDGHLEDAAFGDLTDFERMQDRHNGLRAEVG